MKKGRFVTLLLSFLVSIATFAQKLDFAGTVVDASGEPIIGASVVLKGTTQGVITDINGEFKISGQQGSVLVVSYVGYETQELKGSHDMRVVLVEDNKTLGEVVVIGYGVQKKSVVTASIAKVSADDLSNKGLVRMDNALKGLAAGVQVTSASGQPGEAARVRVRGTGTINNSDPLYIVDGMAIGGGLDFLNPSDIESIEVLKDAASGAIYGARAANGVILVTTKKGKQGKTQVNYNGAWGWSSAARRREVTSATDYAILQNEFYLSGGQAQKYADPYNLKDPNGNVISGFGTDWQDLVFNDNAPQQNHEVSVSGASETVNYYVSAGYFEQDGIIGGNYGQSNYDRLTFNSNMQVKLMDATKERNFLNKADLTVKMSYANIHNTGISTNSEFGSILGSALYMSPILTPTITGDAGKDMILKYKERGYVLPVDALGNPYSIPGDNGTYQEMNNPLAMLAAQNPTKNWSHKIVPNIALDIQLWDNLKFRSSLSADISFWGNNGAVKSLYYFSGNNKKEHTEVSVYKAQGSTIQLENVLMYDKTFGKHTISAVLGQSFTKYQGDDVSAYRWNLVNVNKPSLGYTTAGIVNSFYQDNEGNFISGELADGTKLDKVINGTQVEYGNGGGVYAQHRLASLFARFSYDYDERYMLQATIRRDGSSRFGSNHKFGYFPSFSAGWNVMNEAFMEDTHDWLNNFKVRVSWGKNGNEEIGNFTYAAYSSMNNNYLFGSAASKYIGSKSNIMPNPDLRWEESEQTDLGLDFGFFNNALTFTVDYFIKKTNGMIIERPIPSYTGENKPQANVGDMKNSGWEFELGYKWSISDAKFGIKGNVSYLKNELVNLGNADGFMNLDGVQSIAELSTRAENGFCFPFFYGYKTAGILQNPAEAEAYNTQFGLNRVPGDVRFVDVNGDGTIDSNDRTYIGDGNPDWTFGINFNAEWKGFDLNVFAQGVQGADILDATYRTDVYSGNYPTWMLNRWTGEGTSTKYPRLSATGSYNWVGSDLYVCDGSYFRIKTLQIGYTFPQKLTKKFFVDRLRVYGSADNLITWTKYWGFDPEISSGAKSLGVDRGVYPQARTFTVGVNLTLAGSSKK